MFSFQKQLAKNGYTNNELISLKLVQDSLYLAQIHLKNKIEKTLVYIDPLLFTKTYFSKLPLPEIKNDSISIPYNKLEHELTLYNKIISASGFPFSSVQLIEIKQKNSTTLSAKLIISTQNQKRNLNKITLKGYEKFPKSFLKRYLKIKPNTVFDIESINKKLLTLNNLSFTRQTKSPEVLFTKDSTQLYLYLEKNTSNNFDGFIGFSTDKNTNKIEFNGYLNLVLVNNLNYGESLSLDYKSDESGQKNLNLIANLPYLFGSPLGLETILNITKRDSSFITTKQKTNLYYQLNDKTTLYGGIETIESSNISNIDLINVIDYKSTFYTFKYQYLRLQNNEKLFPTKSQVKIELGLGNRKTFFGNENQNTINLNASHIFNLNNKNSIYINNKIQIIHSENYLENELFTFGGINSIRGFAENSLTANNIITINTEYRYKLSSTIYVNSVIDLAHFKNNIYNQKETLYGFGLGVGILTKGGLLRFIYANGKNQTETFNFSNSKIHLSLKAVF